ncbi:MAG: hypothetical protein Q7S66_01990 [bacterium]|nr:hypothetical protein [bacterium]
MAFSRDSRPTNDRGGDRGGNRSFAGRGAGGRSFGGGGGRKFGGGGGFGKDRSARPFMYDAICSKCGKPCQLPFKPTGERPVFCSNCFDREGNATPARAGGRNFDRPSFDRPRFEKPSFDDKQMFDATCSKCGKVCQVPFRPLEGKPVFCSDCFVEKGGNTGGKNNEQLKEQLDALNAKLDKILKILAPATSAVTTVEVKAEKKVKAIAKKVVTKKKK